MAGLRLLIFLIFMNLHSYAEAAEGTLSLTETSLKLKSLSVRIDPSLTSDERFISEITQCLSKKYFITLERMKHVVYARYKKTVQVVFQNKILERLHVIMLFINDLKFDKDTKMAALTELIKIAQADQKAQEQTPNWEISSDSNQDEQEQIGKSEISLLQSLIQLLKKKRRY